MGFWDDKPKLYKFPDGSSIQLMQGRKHTDDRILLATFPKEKFAYSLKFIATALRLKSFIEDINYPPADGYKGKKMLLDFLNDAIMKDISIDDIGKKYNL